jgi:hypothetical protein
MLKIRKYTPKLLQCAEEHPRKREKVLSKLPERREASLTEEGKREDSRFLTPAKIPGDCGQIPLRTEENSFYLRILYSTQL